MSLPPGPFERHMREAIALNESRAPRYAVLSGGASEPISRRLILAERAMIPVARWFDRRAAPYHRGGIPLLEGLFMPMHSSPAFGPPRAPITVALPPEPVAAEMRRRVRIAFVAHGFAGAALALASEIERLMRVPDVDCLVRHLLESAHRLAYRAPRQIEAAIAKGLPSPHSLLATLLRLHLWGLGAAAALDARARPLQIRGIPILAHDLPPIPRDA
ncbi:MAG: hypothetical protein ACJ79K_04100 [Gemmatimonadaceae bacterium]